MNDKLVTLSGLTRYNNKINEVINNKIKNFEPIFIHQANESRGFVCYIEASEMQRALRYIYETKDTTIPVNFGRVSDAEGYLYGAATAELVYKDEHTQTPLFRISYAYPIYDERDQSSEYGPEFLFGDKFNIGWLNFEAGYNKTELTISENCYAKRYELSYNNIVTYENLEHTLTNLSATESDIDSLFVNATVFDFSQDTEGFQGQANVHASSSMTQIQYFANNLGTGYDATVILPEATYEVNILGEEGSPQAVATDKSTGEKIFNVVAQLINETPYIIFAPYTKPAV